MGCGASKARVVAIDPNDLDKLIKDVARARTIMEKQVDSKTLKKIKSSRRFDREEDLAALKIQNLTRAKKAKKKTEAARKERDSKRQKGMKKSAREKVEFAKEYDLARVESNIAACRIQNVARSRAAKTEAKGRRGRRDAVSETVAPKSWQNMGTVSSPQGSTYIGSIGIMSTPTRRRSTY